MASLVSLREDGRGRVYAVSLEGRSTASGAAEVLHSGAPEQEAPVHFDGVIPAALTPFDESGEVDVAALAATAESLIDSGVTGVVATGTMGEAQSLSTHERRRVIETLVGAADGRVTVTAGVSARRRRRPSRTRTEPKRPEPVR